MLLLTLVPYQDGPDKKPWIRATQGHTISKVQDSVHHPVRSADDLGQEHVIHGTFLPAWLKIRTEGRICDCL